MLMKIYDEEGGDRIKRIFKEFKKVDEFYDGFKLEFESEIVGLIKDYYSEFKLDEKCREFINQYAMTVLNTTQTVLDKDDSYPEYKKEADLKAMQAYYAKAVQIAKDNDLADDIYKKTKELVVKYYPKIVDLSGEGFRLLDLNLKLFNMEFVANYNKMG